MLYLYGIFTFSPQNIKRLFYQSHGKKAVLKTEINVLNADLSIVRNLRFRVETVVRITTIYRYLYLLYFSKALH